MTSLPRFAMTAACLTGAAAAMIGVFFGSGIALGAGVGAVLAMAAGEALAWRRTCKRVDSLRGVMREEAVPKGTAHAAAQAVLLAVDVYEASIFPRSGPAGVTATERAARRTDAYAAAAREDVPLKVQVAAQTALAVLDERDGEAVDEATAELRMAVHDHGLSVYIRAS
ncbi:hypothetical protein [Streptomyces sp. NPDC048489]|uniref:hypothetical protein n=1 Tax=Streptomyces sp. NPDC048489 TaxID=3154504 RepID=UPI00343BDD7E